MRFAAIALTTLLVCANLVFGLTGAQGASDSIQPTPVQFGKRTPAEHAWSRAYGRSTAPDQIGKLRQTVEYAKDHNEHGMGITGTICCGGVPGEPPPPLERMRRIACGADTILLGSAKRSAAHLFDDDSYVYTSYDFSVKEVFKDVESKLLRNGSVIEVTRPGGQILVDGIKIVAETEAEKPLLADSDYVLFLRYASGADGYMLAAGAEIYVVNGRSYETMSVGCSSAGLPRKGSTDELLSFVRTAAVGPCDAK